MRPLIDLTDDELIAGLRQEARYVVKWSANDYLREIDRRATVRSTRTLRKLTALLVGATIVYTLATLALVVVTWQKP